MHINAAQWDDQMHAIRVKKNMAVEKHFVNNSDI